MRAEAEIRVIAPTSRECLNDAGDPAKRFGLKERYLIPAFYL